MARLTMNPIKFSVQKGEEGNVLKWIDEHVCKIRGKYGGAIGGAITFCFTDTSIGQIQTVKCACGEHYYIETNL